MLQSPAKRSLGACAGHGPDPLIVTITISALIDQHLLQVAESVHCSLLLSQHIGCQTWVVLPLHHASHCIQQADMEVVPKWL